jgi:hypothetical protein
MLYPRSAEDKGGYLCTNWLKPLKTREKRRVKGVPAAPAWDRSGARTRQVRRATPDHLEVAGDKGIYVGLTP